jgi:hypothetical protein
VQLQVDFSVNPQINDRMTVIVLPNGGDADSYVFIEDYLIETSKNVYQINFSMPHFALEGQYNVKIKLQNSQSIITKNFYYITQNAINTFLISINNLSTTNSTNDFKSILINNKNIISVDTSKVNDNILRAMMTKMPFTTLENFLTNLNLSISLDTIKSDSSTISTQLQTGLYDIDISPTGYFYKLSNKSAVFSFISQNSAQLQISDKSTLEDLFNTAVALQSMNEVTISNRSKVCEYLKTFNELYGLDASSYSYYNGLSADQQLMVSTPMINKLMSGTKFTLLTLLQNEFKSNVDSYKDSLNQPTKQPTGGNGGSKPSQQVVSVDASLVQQIPAIEQQELPFNDIEGYEWAKDSIIQMTEKNIILGVGNGKFSPNSAVTREQFTKMLVLAFNIPKIDSDVNFSDVDKTDWYYPYICNAFGNGIVMGKDDAFGVGESITRQELSVMVVRVLEKLNKKPSNYSNKKFVDTNLISPYAEDAVYTLYGARLINGIGENHFSPLENASRAEAAVLLNRIMTYVAGVE